MSDDIVTVEGRVWGVFAHRFAVETADGKVLADAGPGSLGQFSLREGDQVSLTGERTRSEIKVVRLVTPDGAEHLIEQRKHDGPQRREADPAIAFEAVRMAGFAIVGVPHRKPKHWEVEAIRGERAFVLHVELDGKIRKTKELAD